ncbi:hypothetical protein AArcSl_1559 [Halalkaliarchaeum desulfuricum]|uniref:Uncharacterized protein n=1 Tax=Halalkaliarchaeum desulfuricum TaxID=2055893 RepID=A0A343TJB6_9EURY|nr:hypothetical protein [Halalkaliarchaeum desulfuricum]AUX09188.1 hypothetical protein AArcSl_1559 [Halalkaliarchaeum desulfuricum]
MDERWKHVLRQRIREIGRRYEEAKHAYWEGREEVEGERDRSGAPRYDLPTDEDGNARLVCRRYAERRPVPVDRQGRPACFEPDHPDCEGCREDIQDGTVETYDDHL